jgi:uncharacterized membrane protein
MSAMISLVKGFAGKPSHAPLTDVSVGAYTVGALMLIAGYAGLEEEAMAQGALLAIGAGLLVAIPTILTGLLDWSDLAKGSRARALANYHLVVMLLATAAFAAAFVLQRPGYLDREVTLDGLVAGCVALGLLTLGGTLGGALAYVYGVRVVKRDVSLADALIPGRLDEARPAPRTNVVSAPVDAAPRPASNGAQAAASPYASVAEYEAAITRRG